MPPSIMRDSAVNDGQCDADVERIPIENAAGAAPGHLMVLPEMVLLVTVILP